MLHEYFQTIITRVVFKLERPAGGHFKTLEYNCQTLYREIPQKILLCSLKQFEN